jgi:(1->4)-alpha-D-glucan 1-alpha-D-glucosylmutase
VTAVLKATVPGVPDFYQGTELPAFTLVDPDNRAPVDFDAASTRLEALASVSDLGELLADEQADNAKLYVTSRLLSLRAEDPQLFALGSYQPLQVEGDKKDHVFAFSRTFEDRACVVAVPRWSARLVEGRLELPLSDVWGDTRIVLGEGEYAEFRDVLTAQTLRAQSAERTLRVADVFSRAPIAVLRFA